MTEKIDMYLLKNSFKDLDENENKVDNSGDNNNEKLRQIWTKKNGKSPPSDARSPQERQSPPATRIDPREMQRMISK